MSILISCDWINLLRIRVRKMRRCGESVRSASPIALVLLLLLLPAVDFCQHALRAGIFRHQNQEK